MNVPRKYGPDRSVVLTGRGREHWRLLARRALPSTLDTGPVSAVARRCHRTQWVTVYQLGPSWCTRTAALDRGAGEAQLLRAMIHLWRELGVVP